VKNLAELATVTTTEIAAIAPKVILDQIERAARAARRARVLTRINRDLVAAKGRSIFVPQAQQMTAYSVAEGATPTEETVTYSTIEIVPAKIGLCFKITQEAINGTEFDVINDLVNEAGEAMAEKEDKDIIAAFTETGAAGTTLAAATPGELSYTDILAARSAVIGANYRPTILFVNPDQVSDLLKDDRFIDASKYGDREPIVNGEIGKIAGLKVVETQNMTSGQVLVVDPTRAAWMAIKRDLDLKRKEEPSTDSIEFYLYQEYGVKVVNSDAVALITGA